MPTVPIDGRPQYSLVGMAVSVAMGRARDEFEQIGPDRYVLANSWPAPKPSPGGFSGAVAASQAAPETKPRSAGQALWPHLP